MQIISVEEDVDKLEFQALDDGDVFQREGKSAVYLKCSHSTGKGGNAVRLATGKRCTVPDDELVISRDDAGVTFGHEPVENCCCEDDREPLFSEDELIDDSAETA